MKQEEMTQEEMTQEEMKQKLQKNAFDVYVAVEIVAARGISKAEDELQEAKSSAKKLIEKIDDYLETLKPEFKVGDYVVDERLDYITKIKRISNGFVYGSKIYDLDDSRFGGLNFGCSIESIRQPKSEEIAEYKSALNFHKHGRKPFEVKQGDILRDDEGNIFFVDFPSIRNKEYFTSRDYTFIKTAEEVEEWLGSDDEN